MDFDVKKETLRFLDKAGIEHELFEHEPAFTLEQCAWVEKLTGATVYKNLLLCPSNESEFILLVMGGDKQFVTKDISKKLGTSRLSFAKSERMTELLSTQPGSLSILSLIFDKQRRVRLAVDSRAPRGEYFCCHPCNNSTTLKLKTADIFDRLLPMLGVRPQVIDI